MSHRHLLCRHQYNCGDKESTWHAFQTTPEALATVESLTADTQAVANGCGRKRKTWRTQPHPQTPKWNGNPRYAFGKNIINKFLIRLPLIIRTPLLRHTECACRSTTTPNNKRVSSVRAVRAPHQAFWEGSSSPSDPSPSWVEATLNISRASSLSGMLNRARAYCSRIVRVMPCCSTANGACRQGWRAWVFQQWSASGRHEVAALPELTSSVFRALRVDDVRNWVLSSAAAAAVGLGSTFSPPGLVLLILLRSLPCVRGVVSLWVTGIMSVGLVLSVLSMPPQNPRAHSLHALVGLSSLLTWIILRSHEFARGWRNAKWNSGPLRIRQTSKDYGSAVQYLALGWCTSKSSSKNINKI